MDILELSWCNQEQQLNMTTSQHKKGELLVKVPGFTAEEAISIWLIPFNYRNHDSLATKLKHHGDTPFDRPYRGKGNVFIPFWSW